MTKHLYWLSDAEWSKIEPLLPRGRRGARRVDDRRVISGIIHMLKTGARWRDCPAAYGPYTTIYNRYHRWSLQGVWFAIFEALTGSSGVYGTPQSMPPTSRRTARRLGQKGGLRVSDRPLARRAHHQDQRPDRRGGPPLRAVADARQCP
jgi:transposase